MFFFTPEVLLVPECCYNIFQLSHQRILSVPYVCITFFEDVNSVVHVTHRSPLGASSDRICFRRSANRTCSNVIVRTKQTNCGDTAYNLQQLPISDGCECLCFHCCCMRLAVQVVRLCSYVRAALVRDVPQWTRYITWAGLSPKIRILQPMSASTNYPDTSISQR